MSVRSVVIAMTGVAISPPQLTTPLNSSRSTGTASGTLTVGHLLEWIKADGGHMMAEVKLVDLNTLTPLHQEPLAADMDILVFTTVSDAMEWGARHKGEVEQTPDHRCLMQQRADEALLAQLDTHNTFLRAQYEKAKVALVEVDESLSRIPPDAVVRAVEAIREVRMMGDRGVTLGDRVQADRLIPAHQRAMETLPRYRERLAAILAKLDAITVLRTEEAQKILPSGPPEARLNHLEERYRVVRKSANDAEVQRQQLSDIWRDARRTREHVVMRFEVVETLPHAYADACRLLKSRVSLRRALHRVHTFLQPAYKAVDTQHREFFERWKHFPSSVIPNLHDARVCRLHVVDDAVAKAADDAEDDEEDAADALLRQCGLFCTDPTTTRLRKEIAERDEWLQVEQMKHSSTLQELDRIRQLALSLIEEAETLQRHGIEDQELVETTGWVMSQKNPRAFTDAATSAMTTKTPTRDVPRAAPPPPFHTPVEEATFPMTLVGTTVDFSKDGDGHWVYADPANPLRMVRAVNAAKKLGASKFKFHVVSIGKKISQELWECEVSVGRSAQGK